jgi:hypothetical protein
MKESISEPRTLFSATEFVPTKSENNHDFDESSRRFTLDREFINIESHQLVWLGMNESFSPSIQDLRRIVDYTKLFSTADKCLEYIERTKNTATFIVCSREFGSILTSKLHNYEYISKIYVYDFVNTITDSEKIWLSSSSRVSHTKIP